MLRKTLLTAMAGTALVCAGAVAAKPGGGNGHAMGGSMGHGPVAHAPVVHSTAGRVKSQGLYHASASGVLHANSHSVLKGTVVVGGPIAGLTNGMTVVDVNGNTVGTVKRINTASGGRVVNVLVKSSTSARTIPLSPSTLSVSGGVATTTSLRRHSKG
jgi:hypothetical protein